MLPTIISPEANIILAEVNVSQFSYLTLSTGPKGFPIDDRLALDRVNSISAIWHS